MTRNLEEFNDCYKGYPCFIVGAGTSVHFQNLALIRPYPVIAVNSGHVAVPWANFFVSDDWSCAHWNYFFDLLAKSNTIPLLYEDKLANHVDQFPQGAVLFRHQRDHRIVDKYIHGLPKHHIGGSRTSLGTAIMIAHIMGCRPIALLGADGVRQWGVRYFWQLPTDTSPYRKVPYPRLYRNDKTSVDKYSKCKVNGKITDTDLRDICRSWSKLGPLLASRCEVYNTSEISVIKSFPKLKLENFIERFG